MAVATIDHALRTGTRVQRLIDTFVEGGPLRSVLVQVHEPVSDVWTANPHTEHPAASLLKIPLVAGVLMAIERHEISPDHRVRPDQIGETAYPTVRAAFSASTITLLELSALAILTSDNAAATYILDLLGVDPYLRFMSEAGCEHTGIPPGFNDEHFALLREVKTTASDQNRILSYVWDTDQLKPLRGWMANNVLNGRLSACTEPPSVFAHKTGTLEGTLHDVGMLITPEFRASLIVLTSNEADPIATTAQMASLGDCLASELESLTTHQT